MRNQLCAQVVQVKYIAQDAQANLIKPFAHAQSTTVCAQVVQDNYVA